MRLRARCPGEEEILQNALLIERMVVENDREQLSKEDRLLLTECIRQSYQAKTQPRRGSRPQRRAEDPQQPDLRQRQVAGQPAPRLVPRRLVRKSI